MVSATMGYNSDTQRAIEHPISHARQILTKRITQIMQLISGKDIESLLPMVLKTLKETMIDCESARNALGNSNINKPREDATDTQWTELKPPQWAKPMIDFIEKQMRTQESTGNNRSGNKGHRNTQRSWAKVAGDRSYNSLINLTKTNLNITGNTKIVNKLIKRIKIRIGEDD